MNYKSITELQIDDKFEYLNGASGYPCKVVGTNKTPTGRFSIQYTFGGKICKQNKIGLQVLIKPKA